MILKVGDIVAFNRKRATISSHACEAWGIDYINQLEFKNCKFFKGRITKVKTHAIQFFCFRFFKLHSPIYLIDDYYLSVEIKPVKRVYAQTKEQCLNPDCHVFCPDCALF